MKKQQTLRFTFITIFCCAFLFLLWKIPYGFGGQDEYFYLTVPFRFLQGDKPFVNEWHLSQLGGFPLIPFVYIYKLIFNSTEGIILAARYVYLTTHSLATIIVFCRMKKYGFSSIVLSLSFFLFIPWGIMANSYNSMAVDILTIIAVLFCTVKKPKKALLISIGILYSCAVLCSPFLALVYLIYILFSLTALQKKCSNSFISSSSSIYVSIGVLFAAILFFVFLLSRVSISEILTFAPILLSDPEHSSATIFEKLYELRQSTSVFFVIGLVAYLAVLIAVFLDKNRIRRRKFYLIIASALSIFSFALSWRCFNLVMTPLFFTGSISYILCKNKETTKDCLWFYIIGFSYTIAVYLASNTGMAAVSMSLSVVNIANIVFIFQIINEIYSEEKGISKSITLIALVGVIVVLLFCQVHERRVNCFFDKNPVVLNTEIVEGPAKGIRTTKDNADNYRQIINDLNTIRDIEHAQILIADKKPWAYLYLENSSPATFTGWIAGDTSINRWKEYYILNPDKTPEYIYLPYNSHFSFDDISSLTANDYLCNELNYGYLLSVIQ